MEKLFAAALTAVLCNGIDIDHLRRTAWTVVSRESPGNVSWKFLLDSLPDMFKVGRNMKNWYALDFDDSKLRYAKSLGDVLSPPEYLRSRVVKCMTTPEEYKKYEEAFAGSLVLPASLEKEPEADVKVVWKGDTPGIQVADGKILPPVLLIMKTAGTDTYDDMILRAYGAGVRMFQIVVPFDDLADDPQAAVSGRWMDDQRPAFVLKQLPNGGISIFSGTTLTITSRWTQLLDALGIPAVVDGEYYVSANNCYLNIPLAENQSTTVTLPEKCFIRDVWTNEVLSVHGDTVTLKADKTRTWLLEVDKDLDLRPAELNSLPLIAAKLAGINTFDRQRTLFFRDKSNWQSVILFNRDGVTGTTANGREMIGTRFVIDPRKKYRLSGEFRVTGVPGNKLGSFYFGFVPYWNML